MQLKRIKKIMQTVEQAIGVSSTILDVAILNAVNSKRKMAYYNKALNICQKISAKYRIPTSEKISIILFSDTGFCGPFNKCPREFCRDKFYIGKKAPGKTINLHEALCNTNLLNEFLGENYNIDVYVKNFKTQAFDVFKFPQSIRSKEVNEVIISSDISFPLLYRQYFMEYCINVALFNENSYRVCFMNNALDNCQSEKRKLKLQISKCRQESINNEIALSSQ
jgi:F0F1-type ATP synthase gamma subunit